MRYVTKLGHQLVTKNKLQSAVNKYLVGLDRILLNNGAEIEAFKAHVIAKIEVLNAMHPRCKPLTPSWYQIGMNNDVYLSGIEFCLFNLHEVYYDFYQAPSNHL